MDRDRDMKRYRSMMRGVQAPDRLSDKVLEQARAQEGRCDSAAHDRGRQLDAPAPKRPRVRLLAAAACLVLVVCLASAGVLYATENPGATAPNSFDVELGSPFGFGGHSGPWYNPETERFWPDDSWVGYKYGMNLKCTGNNIENFEYTIQGERAYFEIISPKPYSETGEEPHVFHYKKSLSFDYENQYDLEKPWEDRTINDETRLYSIYIGYPAPQETRDLWESVLTGESPNTREHHEAADRIDFLLEKSASQELSEVVLKATATFADGSTRTKSYGFTTVDNYDDLMLEYIQTRHDDDFQYPVTYRMYEIGGE